MPKAYSNIGNAMIAHYEQRKAAEAANQQLMMSLLAPMEYKQMEAERDRAAKKADAEYRYQEENKLLDRKRKLELEKLGFERQTEVLITLLEELAKTEREKYKVDHKEGSSPPTYSPSELTAAGGTGMKIGEADKAQKQDLERHQKILQMMSLSEDQIKKIGSSDPILADLKAVWKEKQPFWGIGDEIKPSYDDYALALGLTKDRVKEALIANDKEGLSEQIATSLTGIASVPEEQGRQIVSGALGTISGFEDMLSPESGADSLTVEQYAEKVVDELFKQGGQEDLEDERKRMTKELYPGAY